MHYGKLIIFVFVFILAVSFAAQNTQPITLRYYFNWETGSFPMYLLMFIPFFVGIVVGSLIAFGSRLRLKNTVKHLTRTNRDLDEDLKRAKEAQIPKGFETTMEEEKPMASGEVSAP